MSHRYIFFLIFGLDALILFFQTLNVSISANEASLLYGDFSFLQVLINFSLSIFGQNDFGLRFVMIFFHLMSLILMYQISSRYISSQRDRLWLIIVFVLLPGVLSSAIVVNNAGVVIFGLLLFIYLSEKIPQFYLNLLLLLYSLISIGFAYLFLGLAVYYIFQKDRLLALYMLCLYLLTSFMYGFEVYGLPQGHFLDTIGIYSAVFSPIIFIYLFYSLYRRYLTSKIDIIWYISSTVLILSLVLSFRQRISIEYFAPYLIIALPLAADSFISSYKVRLKMFRTKYKMAFVLSFIFLVSNTIIVLFNKEIYSFIDKPKQHFAYNMHIAKELANKLKKRDINCLKTDDDMQKRLKFYNINFCNENILEEVNISSDLKNSVTISYKNKAIYKASVTKINNI